MEHCFVLLGGDTVAPSGLYASLARLCHAFLVSFLGLFFTMSKAVSVSTGPIFTIFLPNGRYLCEFSWSGPVFLIPQGTLPWQPIKVEKLAFFYGPIYFIALTFGNGLQYRKSDFKRLDRMKISTSCAILVTFRRETSEFLVLTIASFVAIWQKSAYHAKYLRMF